MNFILGLIFFVLIFVGFYAACEMYSFSELYFARDYYCPEKFRLKQKVTDLVSICYNFFLMTFTIFFVILIAENFGNSYETFEDINNKFYWATVILGVSTVGIIEVCNRKYSLVQEKDKIHTQWNSEKVFNKEHDHEVNLYRGCKYVTETCSKYSVVMLIILIVTGFLL